MRKNNTNYAFWIVLLLGALLIYFLSGEEEPKELTHAQNGGENVLLIFLIDHQDINYREPYTGCNEFVSVAGGKCIPVQQIFDQVNCCSVFSAAGTDDVKSLSFRKV